MADPLDERKMVANYTVFLVKFDDGTFDATVNNVNVVPDPTLNSAEGVSAGEALSTVFVQLGLEQAVTP